MYRLDGDQVIGYTVEDFLLFKESPFASWMERLTFENPLHGIEPDEINEPRNIHNLAQPGIFFSHKPDVESIRWNDLVGARPAAGIQALHAKHPQLRHPLLGRIDVPDDVFVVKKMDDVLRRKETLAAMRSGVSLIVNAQLAVGPLSGEVDLLMRTSGLSELGDHIYIPCDTSSRERPHRELALCYAADLLHSMQGSLPSKLLVICSEREILPLNTEDHIYHYRAVKQSFMVAQSSFRKHCMPNPEDSSSFGRWSNCANDVMKRRANVPSAEVFIAKNANAAAAEIHRAPAPQLRGVPKKEEARSYIDLDWPGMHRDLTQQQTFADALITSNGTDF